MRKIIVSDVHGNYHTLQRLLFHKVKLQPQDELYFLGDLIDRGPHSKAVIDFVLEEQAKGRKVVCLRGNHEQMLLDAHTHIADAEIWKNTAGGLETLQSFSVNSVALIPANYWHFWENMPYYLELKDAWLVHAGFNFAAKKPLEDTTAMLWIRKWYKQLNFDKLKKKLIIHGHTPNTKKEIKQSLRDSKNFPVLNIDAGCYAVWKEGMGRLCAFDLTNRCLYFQRNIDANWFW